MKYKIKTFFNTLVVLLLTSFVLSCSQPNYYESDLRAAYINSDYSLMKKCLKNGVSPDFRISENLSSEILHKLGGNNSNNYECYLLQSAVIKGDYKAIKLLLKYASDTVKDSFSNTPLHIAIKLQDYKSFKLLKSETVANYVDDFGNTPLLAAIKLDDSKLYNPLIDIEGALKWQNYAGESALMIAAQNQNRDLEKKLLKKEIDIDLRDKDGNSLLMRSVIKEDIDEIKFLLLNNANVNIINNDKKNALALAAEKGNKDISSILLNANVNVDNANSEGKSALMTAVEKNDFDLVSDLLTAGSNVNIQDNNGDSALSIAVKNDSSKIVEILLSNKADPNLLDNEGKSALFYSLSNSNLDISNQLIVHFADVDINISEDVSFVKCFIESNNTDFSKLLIDNRANLDFVDEQERAPLLIAFENNNPAIIESLVSRKVDVNLNDSNDRNILLVAIDNNDLRIIKALLSGGADANMLYDETPLISKAINESNIELVKLLVAAEADVNICNDENEPLLLSAVSDNDTDLSLALIQGGAKGHICNQNQQYLMNIALSNRNKTICKALLDCPDSSEIINNEGKFFLIETVKDSEIETLEKMLSLNMNPNEMDKDGNTLLTNAINNNDLESVKLLVSYGVDSSIKNNIGKSSRDYLKNASFSIKYEVGKTIYHYTDGEIRLIIVIIIILILAFIVYRIIDHKKVNEKWESETDKRVEDNKKVSKKQNSKESEPRKVFRVIQLFEQISTIEIPNKENKVFNFLIISLLRTINPFVNTRDIYKDLFESQYSVQVKEKYQIEDFDLSKEKLKPELKVLKKYKKHGKDLRVNVLNYIHLLYLYLDLKILPDEYKVITSYLGYAKPNNKKRILKIAEKIEDGYKYKDLEILDFIEVQENYSQKKTFNIAVCATMSSGKSTFINALLGSDCLPARNEATTAIITSVYDLDRMTKTIGYATRADIPAEISNVADLEKIDKWNDVPDNFNHIYLQGDFDYISCENKISVIHDTPGTNNSGDKSHHDITMEFLSSKKIDAIIFVVNGEHIASTDEKALLSEIFKTKVSIDKTPIIFALNKADNIDKEKKEDLNTIVENYKTYLSEIGFENPKIFPVSSKAARLIKMVINGKVSLFSEDEIDDFYLEYKRFSKNYDFSKGISSFNDDSTRTILVENNQYDLNALKSALIKTGLKNIELEIESMLK